jgi:hypothetical protein
MFRFISPGALRYAVLFGLTALLAARAVFLTPVPWLAVLLAWLGLALAGMALAYALDSPAPLRKQPGGRISPIGYLVFWPVIGLNRLILLGHRLLIREALLDEIVPGVFLGGRPWRFDLGRLRALQIQSVMDLTAEFSETNGVRNLRYGGFFLMDARPGSLESLERAMAWIDDARADGPVLVHCALGHGRSAMVVAAYLIHTGEARDAPSAIERVRQCRPGIELRGEQVGLLREFAMGRRENG